MNFHLTSISGGSSNSSNTSGVVVVKLLMLLVEFQDFPHQGSNFEIHNSSVLVKPAHQQEKVIQALLLSPSLVMTVTIRILGN